MPLYTYRIDGINGVVELASKNRTEPFHQLTFRQNGSATAGTMTIKARPRGADEFLEIQASSGAGTTIPLNDLDLTDFLTFQLSQFTGDVLDYEITLSGIVGVNSLTMTDIAKSYVLGD